MNDRLWVGSADKWVVVGAGSFGMWTSHASITPTFPFGSTHEIAWDYVK